LSIYAVAGAPRFNLAGNEPAVRLRELMAEDRRFWPHIGFDEAFRSNVDLIAGELTPLKAAWWREAFESTRDAWQAGWERRKPDIDTGLGAPDLTPDLIDDFERVESVGMHLVAFS
jgi:hypothetical protein